MIFNCSRSLILWLAIFLTIKKFTLCRCMNGLYVDNGFDQTVAHRDITQKEKRGITYDILKLLDLPIKSNGLRKTLIEVQTSAYKYILNLYDNLDKKKAYGNNSNQQNITVIEESDIIMTYSNLLNHNVRNQVLFNVSETPIIDRVINAELHIYLKASKNAFIVSIYNIIKRKKKKYIQLDDSINIPSNYEGWIKFNATKGLRKWIKHSKSSEELGYVIVGNKLKNASILQANNKNPEKQPFLVGYFTSSKISNKQFTGNRWKRSNYFVTSNYLNNPFILKDTWKRRFTSSACKLKTLYVSFRDLEFDNFITAPGGYEAQFCSGECRFPLTAHMNATNHAIVQTLVHFLKPERVPQACCAPRELADLPVLYSRDGVNHVLKRYHNMVIKSCGCH